MRGFVFMLCLAFVVTLAAVIGARISAEGRAFLMGVGVGVATSVPASLLAFYVTRRDDRQSEPVEQPGYRPLVIYNDPARPGMPLPDYPPLSGRESPPGAQTRYRIIGE